MLCVLFYLALVAVLVMLLILQLVKKITGKIGVFFVMQQKTLADVNAYVEEMVNGQKVKMSNVELPVLFTLRLLGPLSVFAGPAFALSDSSYYRIDGERREFGNAKPTLTYMAGAAVRLNHLVLDCRFNGAFNKTENYFEGVYPRIKSYQLLFSVGYAF